MATKKESNKKKSPNKKEKQRKEGFQYTKKFTKEVISEIMDIRNSEGLTPKNVLNRAKRKTNPLHNFFEWDNNKAAQKFREYQCNVLINEVKVVIEGKLYDGFENVKVKVDGQYQRVYEPITEIISSEELRRQVIETALKHLEGWRAKYHAYSELKPIVLKIDEVSKKLNGKWQQRKKPQQKPRQQKPKSKSKKR